MGLWTKLTDLFNRSSRRLNPPSLEGLQEIIGYHFRDLKILELSLTHRSYYYHNSSTDEANERLEFLGDSVLGMIISHQLFLDYPQDREGDLTKMKAMLVNETTLAATGRKAGINRFIRLSSEEDRAGGRERPSIISDSVESVIAAVYIDGGLDAARDVILRLLYVDRDAIISDISQRNYKGELLECVQAKGDGMPRYEVVSEAGPDHHKTFEVEVAVSGNRIGTGCGNSKKEAEQEAASEALKLYQSKS